MNQHEFLLQLQRALRPLPPEQREEILADYRAHFFEARERGKSEEAVAQALGEPKALARSYVADYHVAQIQGPQSQQGWSGSIYHLLRALIVALTILAFNFFFMLWPILAISIMLGVAWLLSGLTVFGSLLLGVGVLAGQVDSAEVIGLGAKFAFFFYSLGVCGLALLFSAGLFVLSRWFVVGIMKYIKLNAKVIEPS